MRYHVERFDWSNGVPGSRHKYPATVYCMSETHDVALLAVQESATGGPLPSVKWSLPNSSQNPASNY